jgi:hypothetical protein
VPQVPGDKKDAQTVRLAPSIWARIDQLIGVYGNSRSEVLGYITLNWFATHQIEIDQMKGGRTR